ncbi:MAG: hypothetical protein CFE43_20935 [Burkholderiales bacterium PBB3]|nr:MAG: hypothetical protein CFE43_20935 [Burkholderiales bacterium PBB3]
MFVTFDHYAWPFLNPISEAGERTWKCADIQFFDLWFLLSFYQTQDHRGKSLEIVRTMFVSDWRDVLPMLQQSGSSVFRFKCVQIVTPSKMNSSGDWEMEPISKVWSGREPTEKVGDISIFETRSGKKYASNPGNTPVDRLVIQSLAFDLLPGGE